MRLGKLSCSATSYSQSILSADVAILAELVRILAFFKKRVLPLTWPWERQRSLGTTSDSSIAFYEIQAVNVRLQIAEEDFN